MNYALVVILTALTACSPVTNEASTENLMKDHELSRFRGKAIEDSGKAVFCFYEDDELKQVSTFLEGFQITVDPQMLIGTFPCGDIVFDQAGKIGVIEHDSLEQWESSVLVDEFLHRTSHSPLDLEEWLYGNAR